MLLVNNAMSVTYVMYNLYNQDIINIPQLLCIQVLQWIDKNRDMLYNCMIVEVRRTAGMDVDSETGFIEKFYTLNAESTNHRLKGKRVFARRLEQHNSCYR